MLAAGASFALMSVFVKLAAGQFSSHELVFWRSVLGLVFIYAFLRLTGHGGERLVGANLALHLRRGLVGFVALATFFYAVVKLPMSVAITLNYTSPLFLALIMPWWLHERPRPVQYLAVALGFLGVALLLRPWHGESDLVTGLVGLFSGFMASLAYVHVRQLGQLHEPEWRTVFWFAVVGAVGAGLFASVTGWHAPSVDNAWLLVFIGLFATFGQLAMTRAYRTGDTVVVASLAYSTVVFGSLLDGLIWNEKLPAVAWLGIAITVAAGVWAVTLNKKEQT
ncbi:MAG: DMT family transporter [Thiobacillus sp.]|nr:DMT family transporter [Thiobacillus sp.]